MQANDAIFISPRLFSAAQTHRIFHLHLYFDDDNATQLSSPKHTSPLYTKLALSPKKNGPWQPT